ncbi:MAG: pgm [Ilumatobacteraceae bacterium]|nr:pgm [Ilumatobacteraceae bacterium]
MTDVRANAERWLAAEPDEDMREELRDLLDGPAQVLVERFVGRLQFGTAGLRAAVGAGPQRMNRLVVRQAAAGLVDHLLRTEPNAARRGVLIGYDARRKSDVFAMDTARACAARGVRAMVFSTVVPTPVLAWCIAEVGAVAGVMVTASHNPPADNGYKVYLGTGAQIVPPADSEIAAAIDTVDPCDVALAGENDPLISKVGRRLIDAYLDAVPAVRLVPGLPSVPVAYTAMHGVGGGTLLAAFDRAGWWPPHVVPAQQEPNGAFPTVSFPNPEEPGALDLLLELAARSDAALAIANDPDADRLGAAIPQPDGTWRRLNGDEIGWLLADHVLAHSSGDDRLVVTTLVSSSLLGRMAAAHGVHYRETFTGFKWIGHTALQHPELRLVLGYEQALGYLVCGRPLDKDGITAAVMLTEVAALGAAEGITLQQRLDAIEALYGHHLMAERSVRMEPADAKALVAALKANPPSTLAGSPVTSVEWFDEAGLLRLQLGPALRVQIRPSGTEPKVKLYAEGIDTDPQQALDALTALLG